MEFFVTSGQTEGTESSFKLGAWCQDSASCFCCSKAFSVFSRRRHHCRGCGQNVCGECSSFYCVRFANKEKSNLRLCGSCVQPSTTKRMFLSPVLPRSPSTSSSSKSNEEANNTCYPRSTSVKSCRSTSSASSASTEVNISGGFTIDTTSWDTMSVGTTADTTTYSASSSSSASTSSSRTSTSDSISLNLSLATPTTTTTTFSSNQEKRSIAKCKSCRRSFHKSSSIFLEFCSKDCNAINTVLDLEKKNSLVDMVVGIETGNRLGFSKQQPPQHLAVATTTTITSNSNRILPLKNTNKTVLSALMNTRPGGGDKRVTTVSC